MTTRDICVLHFRHNCATKYATLIYQFVTHYGGVGSVFKIDFFFVCRTHLDIVRK